MHSLAVEAKPEFAGKKPGIGTGADTAGCFNLDRLGSILACRCDLQSRVTLNVILQPALRVVFGAIWKVQWSIVGMQGQKAVFLPTVSRFLVVFLWHRNIFNLAWQYLLDTVAFLKQHREIFLAAVAAEVDRVQAFFVLARQVLLTIGGNDALSRGIDGAVCRSGAGYELM